MAVDDAERVRRRALLKAHLEAENAGDVDAVLATFATGAVMHHNTIAFPSADAIRSAHQYIGFARGEGAFAEARNVVDRESFTDTDIVIEGRMCGRHDREFMGFKPAGRAVELPRPAERYCGQRLHPAKRARAEIKPWQALGAKELATRREFARVFEGADMKVGFVGQFLVAAGER